MSVQAIAWAMRQKVGKPGPKHLLVFLANDMSPQGVGFPGRERLAELLEIEPRTVSTHLGELEQLGLIVRAMRRRKNGSRTSDWIVLAPLFRDRGEMVDANPDEYPPVVAQIAKKGARWVGDVSSHDDSSGDILAPGQVTTEGGPEPLEVPLDQPLPPKPPQGGDDQRPRQRRGAPVGESLEARSERRRRDDEAWARQHVADLPAVFVFMALDRLRMAGRDPDVQAVRDYVTAKMAAHPVTG